LSFEQVQIGQSFTFFTLHDHLPKIQIGHSGSGVRHNKLGQLSIPEHLEVAIFIASFVEYTED